MDTSLTEWHARVAAASDRIYCLVERTPVALIDEEPRTASARAYLKLEHLQKTGSFKLRGATNKLLSLSPKEAALGVITSSTGNHGLGVAAAARHCGVKAEVYVSTQVSPRKLQLIESYGARVSIWGETPLDAELGARAAAEKAGQTYISPYNDAHVVAGQGTIAVELYDQIEALDAVYVAVGGGGLIGGVGAYMKAVSPQTEIAACWPENSRVMYECLKAGRIAEFAEEPTVSESTAGGVEPGSLTFELCRRVIDHCVLVSEQEILEAMRWAHGRGWPVEGAAAVAIAAFWKDASRLGPRTAAIISCGENTSPEVLSRL